MPARGRWTPGLIALAFVALLGLSWLGIDRYFHNGAAASDPPKKGALNADAISQHIAPLFSRELSANRGRVYLANHSLGRPLDATADDLAQTSSFPWEADARRTVAHTALWVNVEMSKNVAEIG